MSVEEEKSVVVCDSNTETQFLSTYDTRYLSAARKCIYIVNRHFMSFSMLPNEAINTNLPLPHHNSGKQTTPYTTTQNSVNMMYFWICMSDYIIQVNIN